MKKLKLFCTLAVIVIFISGCAEMNRAPSPAPSSSPVLDRILTRRELRVGMSGDMPPLNMTTKEDKIIGLDVDLATLAAAPTGACALSSARPRGCAARRPCTSATATASRRTSTGRRRWARSGGRTSASEGRACTTAVHICYGYGIQANIDWKLSLGQEWRQYEQVVLALARSRIDQVSLECIHSHVPPDLMALLRGKDVMVGVIDVASEQVETPEEVAATLGRALRFVPRGRLIACTNCGLAPMKRAVAEAKLRALVQGARLADAHAPG